MITDLELTPYQMVLSNPMRSALLWLTKPGSEWGGEGDPRPRHGHDCPHRKQTLDALIDRNLAEPCGHMGSIRSTEEGRALAKAYREYVVKRERLTIAFEEVSDLATEVPGDTGAALRGLMKKRDALSNPTTV